MKIVEKNKIKEDTGRKNGIFKAAWNAKKHCRGCPNKVD